MSSSSTKITTPNKSVICINVSNRLMLAAQSVIDKQPDARVFELLHEVHTARHSYRVVLYYAGGDKTEQVSHIFDIQTMLDMRTEAMTYVTQRLSRMVAELREKVA